MASGGFNGNNPNKAPPSPEPIPLQDLRPPDGDDYGSTTSSARSDAGGSLALGGSGGRGGGEGSRLMPGLTIGGGGSSSGGGGRWGEFGGGYGGFGQQASLSPNTAKLGGGLKPTGFGEIGRRLSTSLHLQSAQNPFSRANFESKLGEAVEEDAKNRRGSGYAPDMKATVLDIKDDEDGNDVPTPRAFQEGLFDALGVSEGWALGPTGARRGSWLPGLDSGGGGLSVGGRGSGEGRRGSWLPGVAPDDDVPPWAVGPDQDIRPMSIVGPDEDDDAPLTASSNMQPMAGSSLKPEGGAFLSPQFTPSFGGPFSSGSSRGRLGDDLNIVEQGMGRSGSISRQKSLSPASAGTFGRRLSTAVGMMSQRVVNLGNDPTAVEQTLRRKSSTKDHDLPPPPSPYLTVPQDQTDIPLDDVTFEKPEPPSQKHHLHRPEHIPHHPHRPHQEHLWRQEQMNPLKGVSLRIFGPDNWLRVRLCSVLVHP